jgi:hypothetical protein
MPRLQQRAETSKSQWIAVEERHGKGILFAGSRFIHGNLLAFAGAVERPGHVDVVEPFRLFVVKPDLAFFRRTAPRSPPGGGLRGAASET